MVYPDAAGVAGAGRELVSVYDRRNLLAEVRDGSSVTTYTYDLAGNRVGQALPNGTATASTFDALNRVTS